MERSNQSSICPKCGRSYPLTHKYWSFNCGKYHNYIRSWVCNKCRKNNYLNGYFNDKNRIFIYYRDERGKNRRKLYLEPRQKKWVSPNIQDSSIISYLSRLGITRETITPELFQLGRVCVEAIQNKQNIRRFLHESSGANVQGKQREDEEVNARQPDTGFVGNCGGSTGI